MQSGSGGTEGEQKEQRAPRKARLQFSATYLTPITALPPSASVSLVRQAFGDIHILLLH